MKLSEFKHILSTLDSVEFVMADDTPIANHFHLTELGYIDKRFMDCGGKLRQEARVQLQLWVANDTEHRLTPSKLIDIINLSEKQLALNGDVEVEVTHQQDETLGLYEVAFDKKHFILVSQHADCLARDVCLTAAAANSCC